MAPRVWGLATHPVALFVCLQIVWIAITVLWVLWFLDSDERLHQLQRTLGPGYLVDGYGVGVLAVGCVLLAALLAGTVLLFVVALRQGRLYVQQRMVLSSITHELRSPLASIQLGLETLERRELALDTRQKILEMAHADVERLRQMVDRILLSARLDRGIDLFESGEQTDCDVLELIRHVVDKVRPLDKELDQRLVVECSQGLKARLPRQGFYLVLMNLMENAVKYSPARSPILVRAQSQDAGGVLISVKDSGIGLERGEKRALFRMFQRGKRVQNHAIPGTGLGLYIVKSIVSTMGGRVWAESHGRDCGTTFCVHLPRVVVEY